MPRLLSVNNYFYLRGGSETVFFEHNRLFENSGWEVIPFSMHHPKNQPSKWSRYFVNELELGHDYSLLQKLARVPKVVYSFEARNKLAKLLEESPPDLCHAHNIYHHLSPSILGLLHNRGVPTVLTLHDLKIACPAYNMLASDGICERCKGGRVHNVVLKSCINGSTMMSSVIMVEALVHRLIGSYSRSIDRFVAPSRFYIDKLVEWGMDPSRFSHVPNFVEAARFQPVFEPGRYFVYFGRITREKGIASLIRASVISGVRLKIVGTGPDLDAMRRLASDLGADAEFLGYLTGNALHTAVQNARAVVLPSEWYENAPMSVLEAYALGKPMIGAEIGGIPELIKNGSTGFCFKPGDVTSLSSALRNLMDASDTQVSQMGKSGRAWVESEFTAASYRDRILAVYASLGGINVGSSATGSGG